MTLAQLEQAAEDAAWDRDYTRHGYAHHWTPLGKLSVTHKRGPERKKGQRRYTLNFVEISKMRAAELLA